MPLLLDFQVLSLSFIQPPFRGLALRLLQTAILGTLFLRRAPLHRPRLRRRSPGRSASFTPTRTKDEELRKELEDHLSLLRRHGVISGWHDRMIGAGEEWKGQLDKNLEEAQIILLLISPSFLASDYCYDIETKRALDRHDKGEAKVIPIPAPPTRQGKYLVRPAPGTPD